MTLKNMWITLGTFAGGSPEAEVLDLVGKKYQF